ncbi:hypothetical protein, partial [Francisella hispaniensis]|uniref:hypothetical protein n=1 Tax=Francisella hispaniensis TaxID=622488 RepID=UPI00190412CE
ITQDTGLKTDIVITAPAQVTELQSATFTAAASGGRGIDVSKYDWTGVETYLESAGWTDVVVSNEQLTATAPAYVEGGSNTYEIEAGLLKAVDKGGDNATNSKAVSGEITQDTGLKTDIVITAPAQVTELQSATFTAAASGGRGIDVSKYDWDDVKGYLEKAGWTDIASNNDELTATAPAYIPAGSNTYTIAAGSLKAVDKGGVNATNSKAVSGEITLDTGLKTDIVITAPAQVTELQSATFTAAASGVRGIDPSKYDWTDVKTYLESAGWTDVVVSNEQLTAIAPAYIPAGSNTYEIAPGLLKAVDKAGVNATNSKAVSGEILEDPNGATTWTVQLDASDVAAHFNTVNATVSVVDSNHVRIRCSSGTHMSPQDAALQPGQEDRSANFPRMDALWLYYEKTGQWITDTGIYQTPISSNGGIVWGRYGDNPIYTFTCS